MNVVLYPVAVTWMRKRDRSLLANAASLLICGVLAGVVVAAAAFPAIAMGGLAAKAGADTFGDLPTELDVPTPPQQSSLFASDNKTLIAIFYEENRRDIPLSQIPMVMRNAIIAAEDARFYEHNGIDLQGIIRAFISNQSGGDTQGASTLTMQYVRQAITYSATSPADVIAATEDTNVRKLKEARLALNLETVLTKDEILNRYLNIASFGHGAYGIYAASQVYFDKEPKDLTLGEAALLAGLPKAPSLYDPATASGKKRALERRHYVLRQMVETGAITRAQADAAENEKLKITGRRTPNGCVNALNNDWGFFCDYFYRWWVAQPEFGRTEIEREAKLKSGGYRIVTNMDIKIQKSMRKHIAEQAKVTNADAMMLAAIEPGTGRVKALAANRIFGNDTSDNKPNSNPKKKGKGTYPTTTNPLITGGGDIVGYKAGSTFKMFTMLTALEKGYPLDYTIHARSPYKSQVYISNPQDAGHCPGDPTHWCPRNAAPKTMDGLRNMWTGFGRSVNTYFVPLQERVGAENVVEMAKRLGIQFRSSKDREITSSKAKSHLFGPFTIGVTDTVPLELANAYATVAADGVYCKPTPVRAVYDLDGKQLPGVGDAECKQVVDKGVARAAADAARCPVQDTGGLHRCNGATTGYYDGTVAQMVNHPVIGKTGTADENWTANLVLATKQLAIAGTFADPDYPEKAHFGDIFPRKINFAVARTMKDAMKGLPKKDFAKPPAKLINGVKVSVPSVTCRSVADATRQLERRGFSVEVMDEKVDSACPKDTVAKTEPSGSASKNTAITLYLSNGQPPVKPSEPPTDGGPGGGGGGGGSGGGGGGGGGPTDGGGNPR